jgi:hypothetical protein
MARIFRAAQDLMASGAPSGNILGRCVAYYLDLKDAMRFQRVGKIPKKPIWNNFVENI